MRLLLPMIIFYLATAEASYMAGHSSQKVTEKYTHLTAKRLKDKMDRLV